MGNSLLTLTYLKIFTTFVTEKEKQKKTFLTCFNNRQKRRKSLFDSNTHNHSLSHMRSEGGAPLFDTVVVVA